MLDRPVVKTVIYCINYLFNDFVLNIVFLMSYM